VSENAGLAMIAEEMDRGGRGYAHLRKSAIHPAETAGGSIYRYGEPDLDYRDDLLTSMRKLLYRCPVTAGASSFCFHFFYPARR